MDKIYVIATTYEDTDLEMFHCYTSEETCNSISIWQRRIALILENLTLKMILKII